MKCILIFINQNAATIISLSVSILFGFISIYLVILVTNISRKTLYNKIFKAMSEIDNTLICFEEYGTEMTPIVFKNQVDHFDNKLNEITRCIIETKGKIKRLSRELIGIENLGIAIYERKNITPEEYILRVKKTRRYLDLLLNQNNIYGFTISYVKKNGVYSYKHLKKFGLIIGIVEEQDKKSKAFKITHIGNKKLKRKIDKIKKKSIEEPTNIKARKKLMKLYSKRTIIIYHGKNFKNIINKIRLVKRNVILKIKKIVMKLYKRSDGRTRKKENKK